MALEDTGVFFMGSAHRPCRRARQKAPAPQHRIAGAGAILARGARRVRPCGRLRCERVMLHPERGYSPQKKPAPQLRPPRRSKAEAESAEE
jgi:hypothetical protein